MIFYSSIFHILFRLLFFFFNHTATTEIYTLSLHDALPIFRKTRRLERSRRCGQALYPSSRAKTWWLGVNCPPRKGRRKDRKSTRLNSSHVSISYAVFCLKKKKDQLTALQIRLNHQPAADTQ